MKRIKISGRFKHKNFKKGLRRFISMRGRKRARRFY